MIKEEEGEEEEEGASNNNNTNINNKEAHEQEPTKKKRGTNVVKRDDLTVRSSTRDKTAQKKIEVAKYQKEQAKRKVT